MPPEGRPSSSADPKVRLTQLKLQRAQFAARLPTDADHRAVVDAQVEAADAAHAANKERLSKLDEQIKELEKVPVDE